MTESQRIKSLISQGYHVEVVDPDATSFDQKYRVWQDVGWNNLKIAVVNSGNQVSGLQG
tara:strand:+ start:184 stop:360 length:177 start_codon:yes stop_codon:yes gene_type:complete